MWEYCQTLQFHFPCGLYSKLDISSIRIGFKQNDKPKEHMHWNIPIYHCPVHTPAS